MQTLSSAWHHDNSGEVLNKYTMMPHAALPASEEVFGNRDLIKTAFRIAGIYPWDRSAVHWEKLAAGSLYKDKTSEQAEELLPAVEGTVDAMEARAEDAMEVTEAQAEDVVEATEHLIDVVEVDMMNMVNRDAIEVDGQDVVTRSGEENNPGAGAGFPSDWAHDVADPSIMGLVDPSLANTPIPPVVSVDRAEAEMETQASNHPSGSDLANFVPTDGNDSVDIFPEISHEEKVHLLQR